jgi:hypothetical protein
VVDSYSVGLAGFVDLVDYLGLVVFVGLAGSVDLVDCLGLVVFVGQADSVDLVDCLDLADFAVLCLFGYFHSQFAQPIRRIQHFGSGHREVGLGGDLIKITPKTYYFISLFYFEFTFLEKNMI